MPTLDPDWRSTIPVLIDSGDSPYIRVGEDRLVEARCKYPWRPRFLSMSPLFAKSLVITSIQASGKEWLAGGAGVPADYFEQRQNIEELGIPQLPANALIVVGVRNVALAPVRAWGSFFGTVAPATDVAMAPRADVLAHARLTLGSVRLALRSRPDDLPGTVQVVDAELRALDDLIRLTMEAR